MHVCTSETFMIDAIETTGFCPVCCKENQLIKIGWIECQCDGCKNYFSSESANITVEKRRKILGLSRKKMAVKMGLKPKTISNYENIWPSKKYWNKTETLIKSL